MLQGDDNMKDRIQEEARQKFFEDGNEEQEEMGLLESEKELIKDFAKVLFILVALGFIGFIITYLFN